MPKLDEYRRKRDFAKTPEPRPELVEGPPPGDPDAQARNLVFVIQQHSAHRAGMHWDFRLEVEGVLKSWPLRKPPSLDPKVKRGAAMTEDHPYDYRTFEGVIPRGAYGGGQVIVWDEGIYTPDEDGVTSWDDKEEGSRRMLASIEAGKVSFTLQGSKAKGSFALVKTKYRDNSWLLIKHRDEQVSERDLIEDDRSVRSGLTIQDLKEGRMPNQAAATAEAHAKAKPAPFPDPRKERPMLATLVDKAFDSRDWLWEPKLDGIRTLAFVHDGKVDLRSRRAVDVSKSYPAIAASLLEQPAGSIVLDGEICALDEAGVPHFQLLQPRINITRSADIAHAEQDIPVVYFVFDVLYLDGHDLRSVPLAERKLILQSRLQQRDNLKLVSYVAEHGQDVAEGARALGFEGVMGKRAAGIYEPGARSHSWVKVKTVQEQEFLVGGYTAGEGARAKLFGALALGYYDDGKLRYAGNVGSGFNDKELDSVFKQLQKLAVDESPFADKLPGKLKWVQPEMIVQVKFAEWTSDGRLRAPVFIGLRNDIEPRQVGREAATSASTIRSAAAVESPGAPPAVSADDLASLLHQLDGPKANFNVDVGGESIKLTNLDKVFWPAYDDQLPLTKRDLIRYYARVSPWLLPHLKDRPLTLTRYPNGIVGSAFYQKHYEQPIPPYVDTVTIWSESNHADGEYVLCNNLQTLVWLSQIADLELHAWMARVDPEPDAAGRTLTFSGSERNLDDSVLNYPDFMIFDLDPYIYSGQEAKGAEPEFNRRAWAKTVEIALSLKDLLDGLRLSSFIKTTGKTGLHVYVPILRHYDYDDVRVATQTIGRFLIQQHPRDITMEWDTSKRSGKVFFDHNQNTRGKTLAAQYSLRPTAWAGASMPVAWSEVANVDPVTLNLRTIPERLEAQGDPWADILSRKNDLSVLLGG